MNTPTKPGYYWVRAEVAWHGGKMLLVPEVVWVKAIENTSILLVYRHDSAHGAEHLQTFVREHNPIWLGEVLPHDHKKPTLFELNPPLHNTPGSL